MKVPDPRRPFVEQEDDVLLGMLVWGEARGESLEGRRAVAHVPINRLMSGVTWWGHTLKEIILKPKQFSAFNADDPNRKKMLEPLKHDRADVWADCLAAAEEALTDGYDPSHGATHYYDISIPSPPWAQGMIMTAYIGRLRFYAERQPLNALNRDPGAEEAGA